MGVEVCQNFEENFHARFQKLNEAERVCISRAKDLLQQTRKISLF